MRVDCSKFVKNKSFLDDKFNYMDEKTNEIGNELQVFDMVVKPPDSKRDSSLYALFVAVIERYCKI